MSHQTTSNDHVILDVTEEEHQEQINAGFSPESTFKTGKHVGRRGGFAKRHGLSQGDLKPSNAKVKITMWVDGDVLDFFKSRAQEPNMAPYQTQMNNVLRTYVESNGKASILEELSHDAAFIKAIADEVRRQL